MAKSLLSCIVTTVYFRTQNPTTMAFEAKGIEDIMSSHKRAILCFTERRVLFTEGYT